MKYLQQEDEVVHGVVARVQVVLGTQPVAGVKLHLLVHTGVAEEVEQDPLRHPARTEMLHFCRGQRSRGEREGQRSLTRLPTADDVAVTVLSTEPWSEWPKCKRET